MPLYLSGKGPIGICDRCKFKFPLSELKPDRDKPGLRVCDDCNDLKDPWKLKPPTLEKISLPFVRKDTTLICPLPEEE